VVLCKVVERLLPQSSPIEVYNALLLAISLGYDLISQKIIRSAQYPEALRYGGSSDNLVDATQDSNADSVLFTRDVTPLILASQKNQFAIVELLISMGMHTDLVMYIWSVCCTAVSHTFNKLFFLFTVECQSC
jgi:hypothetical protein